MSLLDETQLSLTALAKERGVNVATTWRWCNRGVSGVKLESFALGGKRHTTREAFERFVAATSAAAGITIASSTAKRYAQDVAADERELAAMGI